MAKVHVLRRWALSFGLIAFAALLIREGPELHKIHLRGLGWAVALVLVSNLLWHALRTLSWQYALTGSGRPRFHELFCARLAGEAIGYLSFASGLLGEPVKALLVQHRTPASSSLAALAAERAIYMISGLAFIALAILGAGRQWLHGMAAPWLALIVLAVLLAWSALLVVVAQLRLRFLSGLLRVVSQRRSGLWRRAWAGARHFEDYLFELYATHKSRLAIIALLSLLAYLVGCLEIGLLSATLGVGLRFSQIVLIEAVSKLSNLTNLFIPGAIGAYEGGHALVFSGLGLGSTLGLGLALLRRVRALLWVGVGLVLFWVLHRSESQLAAASRPAST
ncbi:MAG TPA: flippase-like domain-containing protein [Acidobacteriota bacterium]